MSFPYHAVRHFSQRAANSHRSPRVFVMYSYLVAGFTLPFAVPAVKRMNHLEESSKGELSLHHCCR